MERNLWVLKSVENVDRALQTVDNYHDRIDSSYNYDSKVANFKNIKVGDNVILIDKKKILGFAQIEQIDKTENTKIIRKCPSCGSSTIDLRKNLIPKYRCNKGHEFEIPNEKLVNVKRFSAKYESTFLKYTSNTTGLNQLKPYYLKGYNQNMSMQLLDNVALKLFPEGKRLVEMEAASLPLPAEIQKTDIDSQYILLVEDERMIVLRQIRERRGQHKFRAALLEKYGAICMITQCKIPDILEAAHISPYRGEKDNHIDNGLILRADIHTLFDLNLVGIEPNSLIIHFHQRISDEYSAFNNKKLLCINNLFPSKNALITKWKQFTSSVLLNSEPV